MALATDLIDKFDDLEDTTTDVDSTTDNVIDESTDEDEKDTEEDTEVDQEEVDDKKEDDDAEGYFADEDEIEDTKEPELPAVPANFTAEEKFIVENLPLISVRVVMNDDSVKTVQVRSAAELPRDAKGYASFHEGEVFKQAVTAQEMKARELQTYYRQHQSQVQAQEFEKKENQAIREDIAELQRNGEIPKFKAQPGTRAFDSDPAAKIVQETIEFMNDRNAKYLERSNRGGVYRHIGFAEAYELLNAGVKDKADTKDSAARKDAARKLVSRQGGSSKTAPKAPVAGRTIREVAAEFEAFEG